MSQSPYSSGLPEKSERSKSRSISRERSGTSRSPSPSRYEDKNFHRYRKEQHIEEEEEIVKNKGNTVYVHGLPISATKEEVVQTFSKYGQVENVNIIMDPHNNVNRGFCFVSFKTEEEADLALQDAKDLTLNGSKLTIQLSKRSMPRRSTPGTYMGKKLPGTRSIYPPPPRHHYSHEYYHHPQPHYPYSDPYHHHNHHHSRSSHYSHHSSRYRSGSSSSSGSSSRYNPYHMGHQDSGSRHHHSSYSRY